MILCNSILLRFHFTKGSENNLYLVSSNTNLKCILREYKVLHEETVKVVARGWGVGVRTFSCKMTKV